MKELFILGNLIAEYDEIHYPVGEPSLINVIKLWMYEMGLTQTALAKLLGVCYAHNIDKWWNGLKGVIGNFLNPEF